MLIHQFQHPPAAARHAGEGFIGQHDRNARLFHQQTIQIAQQAAAAGEHDAAFGHIRGQLRRRLFQRRLDRPHDDAQRLLQRLQDFVAVQREAARHAFGQMAALDLDLAHFLGREGRADLALDALGRGLADQDAVVAAHVVDDGVVELVAADPRRGRVDDAVERHHGDLGGAATHVQHHGTARLVHRNARAHGGSHGFFDEIHAPGAGAGCRFLDRAALDLGRAIGHADQHTGTGTEVGGIVDLADEVLEHLLGGGEIGDHPVLERPDGGDVTGRAPHHGLGRGAHSLDGLAPPVAVVPDGHDGRLVEHDPPAPGIDQRVGGTEVDGQVIGEKPPKPFEFQHGSV